MLFSLHDNIATTLFSHQLVETGMSKTVNICMLLSTQIIPVPTTMDNLVASSFLNNIGPTILLTHANNVFHFTCVYTSLYSHSVVASNMEYNRIYNGAHFTSFLSKMLNPGR